MAEIISTIIFVGVTLLVGFFAIGSAFFHKSSIESGNEQIEVTVPERTETELTNRPSKRTPIKRKRINKIKKTARYRIPEIID